MTHQEERTVGEDKRVQALTAKMGRLKQRPETWLYTVRRAPHWITPKGERPYRPFLFLVLDEGTGAVLASKLRQEAPTADAALETLAQAMLKPIWGSGGRRRPTEVWLDRADIVQALAPLLAQIGVLCTHRASLPQADEAVHSMATFVNRAEPLAGLLSAPGVTVPLVAEFYAAAAEYYRQAIWRWMNDSQPIEVCCSGEARARYAVILGNGGEAFGLALYDSLKDLRALYHSVDPEHMTMQLSSVAVLFDEQRAMAFDDLDAIEAHGWPIAGENAYPSVSKVVSGARTLAVPTALDLSCAAAALRVLPDYVRRHLRASRGLPREAEVTYPLSGVYCGQQITLRYPVLQATPEEQDAASFSELWSAHLESFIEGWYSDDRSRALAREVGAFVMEFLGRLAASGLTPPTVQRHARNCWWIGCLACRYGRLTHFTRTIFSGEPKFLAEFRRECQPSATALSSYQVTWRKLSRYVDWLEPRQ